MRSIYPMGRMRLLGLLREWNKTHNLTAVDDIEEILSIHIFDSASIKSYVKGVSLLDVGSGAGLPGISYFIASFASKIGRGVKQMK